MSVHLSGPIRGRGLSLTPFGMCRSMHPPSNSRSFCTYKIASHLHIPQLLKVPQFQCFALKSHLTPLVCADARMRGAEGPLRQAFCSENSERSSVAAELSCFQAFTHSQSSAICILCIFSRLRTPRGRGVPPRPYKETDENQEFCS